MSEIYLAATFSRAEEMRAYRKVLANYGHHVTSRWIDGHFPVMKEAEIIANYKVARAYADEDIADILRAQFVIIFTDMASTTGGRHTELGLAFAFGKKIIIVGPRENVFQTCHGIDQYDSWEDLIRSADAASKAGSPEATPFSD